MSATSRAFLLGIDGLLRAGDSKPMTANPVRSFLFPAILWLIAFVCALYPVNEWQIQFFVACILLTFGWAYTMLTRDMQEGWPVPRSSVIVFAALFWVLIVLSVFWSEIKPISLTSVCFFSVLPLTFFGGIMAGKDDYFKKLVKPLACVFAVLSLWAIAQFFLLNNYFHGQARHPLADPSSLGGLFSLALFCALGWVLADRPKREHKFAIAMAILLVCGIVSTVSRGPIFAFVPGIVFFLALLWPQVKARRKSLLIIVMGGLAFYGLMQTGVQKRYDLGTRLAGTVAMGENITNNRIDIWTSTINMIKDRPLLGTGIGTYFLYYPEYRMPTETDGVFLAHNDPLQFWVELGIMGPLLFYAFIFACVIRTFEALKKSGSGNIKDRIVICTIFAALVSMVAQSHVSFNHYNLSILMMTGLLLSVWFHATGRALGEVANLTAMPDNAPPGVNKVLLALPFVMLGWLCLSILGGEYLAGRARDNLFAQNLDAFASDINMADRVSQGLNFRTYLFAVNVPVSILADRKDLLNEEQQAKLYEQTVGYMDKVLAINPRAATAYYYLGKVQSLVRPSVIPKDTKSPEEFYKEALRLDPLHLGARMELNALYKTQGKTDLELLKVLEPGLNYTYTTPVAMEYYGEIARAYLETGNSIKMKEVLYKMAEFKKRADYSLLKQNTSIPQAIMGGDDLLPTQ